MEEQVELEMRYRSAIERDSNTLQYEHRYENKYEAYLDFIGLDGTEDYETLKEYERGYYRNERPEWIESLRARVSERSQLREELLAEYENWKPRTKKVAEKKLSPREEIAAYIKAVREHEAQAREKK